MKIFVHLQDQQELQEQQSLSENIAKVNIFSCVMIIITFQPAMSLAEVCVRKEIIEQECL